MRNPIRTLVCLLALWILGGGIAPAADKDAQQNVPPALAELLKSSPEDFIKRFDKTKKGYLVKDDLPPRLRPVFDRADTNKDGKLDQKEVAALLPMLRKQFGVEAQANPNGQEVDRLVTQWLTRMDTNKDGKISKDEALGGLKDNFDRLDTNKDGFLDKAELRRAAAQFLANRRNNPNAGGPPQVQGPDFDSLDLNADGRLTRDELKGTRFADKFDEIDTNKDGKIDRKEFAAYLRKEAEKKRQEENKKP